MVRSVMRRSLMHVIVIVFTLTVLALAPRVQAQAVESWTSTTVYPIGTDLQSCATYSGYIYCVGGTTANGVTDAVYSASVSNGVVGTWTLSTNSYPISLSDESCAIDSGYIYCVAGFTVTFTNAVYSASVSNGVVGTWTLSTNSYPISVDDESCVADSGYIYCVGGYSVSNAATDAVYSAQVGGGDVGGWTLSTNAYPISINLQSCVADSGYIYCVGGSTGSGYTDAVYSAQVGGGNVGGWTLSANSYPSGPLAMESCAVYSGYVYCVGGDTVFGFTDAVYSAQVGSGNVGAWTATTNYPFADIEFSCGTDSGYIYCVGGWDGSNYRSDVYSGALGAPPEFTYSLSNSGGITVTQGGSGSSYLTATLLTGTSQSVTLSCTGGLPSGASCSFNPASGSPTFPSTLTISTTGSTPTGSYTVTVNGSPAATAATSLTLTVTTAPTFTYSLSNSGGITVAQGSSGSNKITATLKTGTTQSVTLSCTSGLPTGAKCAFSPASGSPTFSSKLTISTTSSTPTGSYTITVNGSPAATAATSFTVKVTTSRKSLSIAGPITPPSPPGGGTTTSSAVSLRVQVLSSGVPVGSASVSVFIDGYKACSGPSSSTGYYTCSYTATAGSHSWYVTATKTGYASGTSPTWKFTYTPSATTYAVTASLKFATTCRTATVTVTLYSGSTQIAMNTVSLSCSKTTGSVKFSMLNSGTYTVTITGSGVTTQSKSATIPPNKTLSFSI